MSSLHSQTILNFQMLPIPIAPDRDGLLNPSVETFDTLPLELSDAAYSKAKRLIDVVGALAGLIMLAPVMAIIALAIRIDSPGPIFFRQWRMGHGGRKFKFLKFRTMVADAEKRLPDLEAQNESKGGVMFKIKNDPRITRLGNFLRRSSLDEVPQLINVLLGDMSLVGPRPLQMRDSDRLQSLTPVGYAKRLSVPQGLTGAWQVGGRSDADCTGMLTLDLGYVENWSVGLDLTIITKTIPAVLTGRGAC